MTAEEVVATGALNAIALYEAVPANVLQKARELLESQGFYSERAFSVMSSGEQRRTLLLRAMMAQPSLLILDEPFESLDIRARVDLERTLVDHVREETTDFGTLTALHRVEEIAPFATHAILLRNGEVFAAGPIEEIVTSTRLSDLYATALIVNRVGNRFSCVPA